MTPHNKKFSAAVSLRALVLPVLWLVGTAATAQPLPTPQADQTRKASFTYDETTGLLKEEWVEPDNPELCVKTTHEYDPYGNRSKSTTAPCPGASSSATFSERYATTDHSVAAQLTPGVLPGSYPLQTANQLGHTERKKFNPAFGQPEELLGPNGLKTTWSHDEFGRKVQETRADGSSTQAAYCYATSADNGPAGSTAAPPATASPARCRPAPTPPSCTPRGPTATAPWQAPGAASTTTACAARSAASRKPSTPATRPPKTGITSQTFYSQGDVEMLKRLVFAVLAIFTSSSHAWGYSSGRVDVFYVNTYGNFADSFLNGGFCFKLTGFDYYFKVKYFDSGERRNNLLLVQSMVLAAQASGKELKATYVDWGQDPTCRVSGATLPAKWLENLQMLN